MQPAVKRPEITPTTPYADLPEWLTLQEAAALLGCSYFTVHKMVSRRQLPFRRFGEKLIYVPKQAFAASTAFEAVTR